MKLTFGQTFRNWRESNKLTQENAGAYFGITRQTVSNWEHENNFPTLDQAVFIANECGFNLNDLEPRHLTKKEIKNRTKIIKITRLQNKVDKIKAQIEKASAEVGGE